MAKTELTETFDKRLDAFKEQFEAKLSCPQATLPINLNNGQ
jgi:hypothetical protein